MALSCGEERQLYRFREIAYHRTPMRATISLGAAIGRTLTLRPIESSEAVWRAAAEVEPQA